MSQPDPDPEVSNDTHRASSKSIQAVAGYELGKGVVAVLSAMALWLWHESLADWLPTLTQTWQGYFGNVFASQIEQLLAKTQTAIAHWQIFVALILVYASLRFVEAYGLWNDKTWAYWFSVIGYGIFIPLELYYLFTRSFDWLKLAVFVLNVVIVWVVYRNMRRKGLI